MRDAGRVLLVTGGAGGIGAAVAARFHAAGWTVRLTDLRTAPSKRSPRDSRAPNGTRRT